MPTTEQIIDNIDKAVTADLTNNNWIKLIIYPFVFFGILATIVTGYIEFKFFTGIFIDFYFVGLLLVIAFEGAKIGVIILYEYVKKHSEINFSKGLTKVMWTLRISLIVFSTICAFSKISQYMETPNFEKVFGEERLKIEKEYKGIIDAEDKVLSSRVDIAKKDMEEESNVFINGVWKGTHYEERKSLYNIAISNRDTRLSVLRKEKDSLIKVLDTNLKTDSKSKNQILVGVYNTFNNIGISTNFNRFYSIFTVLIAAFTTLILELIIWTVFGIIGAIYEGVFRAKLEGYVKMKKTIEDTKVSQFSEEMKSFNLLKNIKRTFQRGFGKTKTFVDSIEDETNNK